MKSQLDELLANLSEEDAKEFLEIQSEWETHIEEFVMSDNIILNEDMGSAFKWQLLSRLREEYRERAIHLQYLNYLK